MIKLLIHTTLSVIIYLASFSFVSACCCVDMSIASSSESHHCEDINKPSQQLKCQCEHTVSHSINSVPQTTVLSVSQNLIFSMAFDSNLYSQTSNSIYRPPIS
jgi:hypothetical protein